MSAVERIPLARPVVAPEAEAAVLEVLRSGHLVRGARVAALERELADLLGVPWVAAVSSGTAALHLAFAAIGVGPGDEVVMPDLTFPCLANVVEHLGATPVTVDVSLETFNATSDALLEAVTPRTRAVVPVDQFGLPAELAPLRSAAEGARWTLVEDAACALGAVRDGVPCGAGATLGCLSFHPRKVATTAEGGAVVTRDEALHQRVMALSNHGQAAGEKFFTFEEAGWNYRMSDVHAAVGVGQLASLGDGIAARRALAGRYVELLEGGRGVRVPSGHRDPSHIFQSFVVLLDGGVDRNRVLEGLRRRGVEATLGSYAIHLQPHFRRRFPELASRSRPGAAEAFERSVSLPLFPGLSEAAQERVVSALSEAISDGSDSR